MILSQWSTHGCGARWAKALEHTAIRRGWERRPTSLRGTDGQNGHAERTAPARMAVSISHQAIYLPQKAGKTVCVYESREALQTERVTPPSTRRLCPVM